MGVIGAGLPAMEPGLAEEETGEYIRRLAMNLRTIAGTGRKYRRNRNLWPRRRPGGHFVPPFDLEAGMLCQWKLRKKSCSLLWGQL